MNGILAVDARSIAEGARSGDPVCEKALEKSACMLARGLAAVYTVLDPQAVILVGAAALAIFPNH